MSFYLKKTRLKGRTYLSIDESFYSHEKKGTAHKCYKSLGSVETHMKNGMEDPIAHFQKEVDELNRKKNEEGKKKISDVSPLRYPGYFPLKSILEKMKIETYMAPFKLTQSFEYDLYELISTLIYARSVHPCSKRKTFHEVLPNLCTPYHYSYDQLLDGLSFLGENHEKFVELFRVQTEAVYGLDMSENYFDCTNFYFEIDREDDFRRKGPSKENRKTPIIGLGLLLDGNQLPVGMKMYPGNKSEKPVAREVLAALKKKSHVTGKTIHVADKGINCAENIAFAKKTGDGYIFSKSVKGLSEKEKTWVLLDNGDFTEVKDKKGKLLYKYKSCTDEFPYSIEHEGKKATVKFTEKRLLTYNPSLAKKKCYEINRMVEKAKSLTMSGAKKSEYGEAGKYVNFTDEKGEKAQISINQDAIDKDLRFAGYNLLVTSEAKMSDEDIYRTYHNLWRIEESFRIMKSDLDARPVFAQTEATIKGHFLICYLTFLLERIFQFKVLKDRFSSSEIFGFIKGFKIAGTENKYINLSTASPVISAMTEQFKLPLEDYFLSETQLKSILNCKL